MNILTHPTTGLHHHSLSFLLPWGMKIIDFKGKISLKTCKQVCKSYINKQYSCILFSVQTANLIFISEITSLTQTCEVEPSKDKPKHLTFLSLTRLQEDAYQCDSITARTRVKFCPPGGWALIYRTFNAMQEIDVAAEAILVLLLLLNHFVNCQSCFTIISLRTIRLFDRGHAPKSTP